MLGERAEARDSPPAMSVLFRTPLLLLFALGCSGTAKTGNPGEATAPGGAPSPVASPSSTAPAGAAASASPDKSQASSAEPTLPGKPPSRPLHELFETLSERDRYSFPHNYVSNETSQLQVASLLLTRSQPGGAYIGVGPEQNFSYIALVKPEVAFIVDIHRRNALLHLLYKAIFDEARTRSEFLCLMIGRPYDASDEPSRQAPIADIIAHVETLGTFRELATTTLARLVERIETKYQVKLTAADKKALAEINKAFYDGQLDIKSEFHLKTAPRSPKLRDQLALRAPDGKELGFLATESAFRYVKRMHAEDRIIPLVGDLAGTKALPGIASYLAAEKIPLRTFYVSNVEQFVFEGKHWPKWVTNVGALPIDERSLFVRTWMNDHPPHPKQLPGGLTTTLIQRIADFRAREQQGSSSRNYQALAFDPSNETVTTSR